MKIWCKLLFFCFFPFLMHHYSFWKQVLQLDVRFRQFRNCLNGRTFPFNVLITVFWHCGYFILNLRGLHSSDLYQKVSKVLLNFNFSNPSFSFNFSEIQKIGTIYFQTYLLTLVWSDQLSHNYYTLPFSPNLEVVLYLDTQFQLWTHFYLRKNHSRQGDRNFYCLESLDHFSCKESGG